MLYIWIHTEDRVKIFAHQCWEKRKQTVTAYGYKANFWDDKSILEPNISSN